jgi:hypothetical protein
VSEVVVAEATESQEADTSDEETVEQEATPTFDETTYKKKVAGLSQANTRIARERDESRASLEAAQKKLAEYEQANLSEMEKLQLEVQRERAAREAAEARLSRVELARQFPLAAEAFGDDPFPSEERLAVIERLAAAAKGGETEEDEDDTTTPILTNTPRRNPPKRERPETADDIEARFRAMQNPFYQG